MVPYPGHRERTRGMVRFHVTMSGLNQTINPDIEFLDTCQTVWHTKFKEHAMLLWKYEENPAKSGLTVNC